MMGWGSGMPSRSPIPSGTKSTDIYPDLQLWKRKMPYAVDALILQKVI